MISRTSIEASAGRLKLTRTPAARASSPSRRFRIIGSAKAIRSISRASSEVTLAGSGTRSATVKLSASAETCGKLVSVSTRVECGNFQARSVRSPIAASTSGSVTLRPSAQTTSSTLLFWPYLASKACRALSPSPSGEKKTRVSDEIGNWKIPVAATRNRPTHNAMVARGSRSIRLIIVFMKRRYPTPFPVSARLT